MPSLDLQYAELYEAIFEAAPDALLLIDQRGQIVTANSRAEKLLGFSRAELRGSPIARLFVEHCSSAQERDGRGRLAAPRDRPTGAGLALSAMRKDGREVPVEISLSPVRVAGRNLFAAVVRDLSSHRAAAGALRESEERFRLLAEGVREYGMFLVDPEGRVTSWNAGAERIFGYSAAEVLGQHVARFHKPEDVASTLPEAILRRAALHGHHVEEGWRVRKDGSHYWATVSTTALYDDRHQLRGFAKLVRDETERRRVQHEREKAMRWLRTVIESCPVGLLLFEGPDGEHVEANSLAIALLGRTLDPGGGSGQYIDQLRHGSGRPMTADELPSNRALRGETIGPSEEYLLQRPDGTTACILSSAAPVFDEQGGIAGAVLAFDDITALKDLERLREEWTTIVAHDLRQPLNAITMHASLLGRRLEDARAKKTTEAIAANARRLDRMIHDLLDLSRLEAARLQIEPRPIDIESIVRTAADRTTALAEGRRVAVSLHGEMPALCADPDRVDQILDNLLSNAIRYGEPGTDVTVEVGGNPDGVVVSVTNRGPGIEPEILPELFQRFHRDEAHAGKRESVGLGLYITKGLVEAHGGHIDVTSTPGETTTFRFTLPVRTAA
jgi:PAS domain S-box-containing protein